MALQTDVLIVGAGPAGAHLGRLLARRGVSVVLADRLPDLRTNAFSSAGTTLDALAKHDIPEHCVGTTLDALAKHDIPEHCVGSPWRHLEIVTTGERGRWEGPAAEAPPGVVLDFGKLRRHLAEEVEKNGGTVHLGTRFLRREGQRAIFQKQGEAFAVEAQVLVDATGPARALMRGATPKGTAYLSGTGIELLVEVPADVYERYRETLVFYMGSRWMPRGYSWIFPMEPNRLKVGAGRMIPGEPEEGPSLRAQVDLLLREEVGCPQARVLDIHGAALKYARGLGDVYVDGPVVAIGDAVSTLNVLGGEGIRHAMEGAEIALPFILKRLAKPDADLRGYRRAMHRRFKRAWRLSEELAIRKYFNDSDARIDHLVRFLRPRPLEFLVDILFRYNFARAARSAGPAYLWRSLKRRVAALVR